MNTRVRIKIAAAILALSAAIPLSARAEAVMHGRVSFDAGGTVVKGVEESEWSEASVNTLILPGDTLWVDNGGTTETEFSGGTFLRMADGSKAEIVSLPPSGVVRGWIGSFYVQRLSRSQGDFVFHTPAGVIEVASDSMVRVDIVDEGITTVSTRWGRATVRTDAGGAVLAHTGKRVFIETGLLPSEPSAYDRSSEDEFDRWNRERAEFLATGGTQTPAAVGISDDTIGVSDLDRYGEWVYVEDRPFWRPTAVVDYTPYRYGYWNNVGPIGNVWVGRYPFSYVTSHYGFWDYTPSYGWVWSYGREWSPAWCATVRYGDYFLWAPVNRYYRPVYPTTSAYFNIGGVSFGYFGTSCVRVSNLYRGPSYVNFANYDPFRQYYGQGNVNVNINIWNINRGGRPHVRVPYNDSVTSVRNYAPRRNIRGASTLYASNQPASERARQLESTRGRSSFSRTDRTGHAFERTNEARIDRSNRTRNVRLSADAPDYARASRSNPVVASATPRGGSGRETLANTRDAGARSGTTPARGGDTIRGAGTIGRGASEGRTGTRGDNVARTSIPDDPNFGRTPMRTRTASPGRSDGDGTSRTGAAAPRLRTEAPDSRTTIRGRGDSAPARTQVRSSVPRVEQAPDRVISRDSGRGSTRAPSAAPGRSTPAYTPPARTSVPERSAPSRSAGPDLTRPTTRDATPIRQQSTPPSSGTVRTRIPESRSTPNVSERSSTRGSVSVPSRSSSPSVSAPSRGSSSRESVSAPSRGSSSRGSVSTPSRNSSPSYTAPSRGSSRSFTAPSRGSSPSYTAPSRSSSPRVSAPSRGSSPRVSAPSRSSSPRVSAPSRSSSPRVSAPSRSGGGRSVAPSRGSSTRGR